MGRQPDQRQIVEDGTAAGGRQKAHDGVNGGRLAHAIAAQQRHDFTGTDAQADVEQDLRGAVGGLQMVDRKHRPHSISSPR
jgi:hypothetical protein